MPPRPPSAPAPGPRNFLNNSTNACSIIGRPNKLTAEQRQAILKAQREAALRRRTLQIRSQRLQGVAPSPSKQSPPQPQPSKQPDIFKMEEDQVLPEEPKEECCIGDDESSIDKCSSFADSEPVITPSASSSSSPRFPSPFEFSSSDDNLQKEEGIIVSPDPVVRIGKPAVKSMKKKPNTEAKKNPPSAFSIDGLGLDDSETMRTFLTSPCPKEAGTVECYVRRDKSGTKKSRFPEYRVYLKEGDKFLLTSKKRKNKKTSNYLISMGKNDYDKSSRNIIGKLRANFIGTEFQIFDDGRNPNHNNAYFDERSDAPIRSELGAIVYSGNVISNRGPRQMQVCISKIDEKTGETTKVWQPVHKDEEMIQCFNHRVPAALRHLVVLENKMPQWNEELGAHFLSFNGRVTKASKKNFQLVEKIGDEEKLVLQFGRVAKEEFTLDFSWPMSPLQAFAVALSSCDEKLACS